MGDRGPIALRYGHLGVATYLPDAQTWEFSRRISRSPPFLIPFENRISNIPANFFTSTGKQRQSDDGDYSDGIPPEAKRQFEVSQRAKEDQLIKNHPAFAPGLPLLRENDRLAQVLLNAGSKAYGISSTLALGSAAATGHSNNRRTRCFLTVFVTPDSPHFVQIVVSEQKKLTWWPHDDGGGNETRTVMVPVIGERQRAFYIENRGQALQIAFAEAVEENSTWMALRFARSTVVLHPLHHRTASAPNYSLDGRIAPDAEFSRLDANPIVDIPVMSTGFYQHADVTFNPWYQQELAIVDTGGNWSAWDVSRVHGKTNVWRKALVVQGALHGEVQHGCSSPKNVSVVVTNADGASLRDHYDGWARILWVANVHTYFVCDRRNLVVFRHNPDTKELSRHVVAFNFVSSSEWVLDVVRSPANLSNVFVLTTTRIVWLHISETDGENDGDQNRNLNAGPRLSWFHFRDHEDITLKLAPLLIAGESSVLLYSHTNPLAQLFRFGFSKNDTTIPISVSDPSIVPLPSGDTTGGRQSPPSTSASASASSTRRANIFSHIILQEIRNSHVNNQRHAGRRHSLVKFIGQRSDFSLVESLFIATTDKDDGDDDDDNENDDYDSLQRLMSIPKELTALSEPVIDDRFIVPDWYEEITPSPVFFQGQDNDKRRRSSLPQAPHNVVDLTRVYRSTILASHASSQSQRQQQQERRPGFGEWVQNFVESVENSHKPHEIKYPTLLEIFDYAPMLDDLEANAHQFTECVQNLQNEPDWSVDPDLNPDPDFEVQFLPLRVSQDAGTFPPLATSASLDQQAVHDLYDYLVRDWILPLSADMPGQARILKEKLVRSVTMELMLARTLVSRRTVAHPSFENDDAFSVMSQSQSQTQTQSQDPGEPPDSSSQLPPSSPLGTAPPSSPHFSFTSSQLSSSRSHSLFSSSFLDQDKHCPTLRQYTGVRQDEPFSRQTINTLSHWKTGADPSAYNWQATVNAIHEEEETRSESQYTRERRRRRELRRGKQRERQLDLESQRSTSTGVPVVRGLSSRSVSVATNDHSQHQQDQPDVVVQIPSTPYSSASRTPSRQSRSRSSPQASSQPQTASVQSRTVSSSVMPMTQTERGAHGSREMQRRRISKGLKKRAAGF